MGKKSLYAGLVLIILPLLIFIYILATHPPNPNESGFVFLIFIIFFLPPILAGIFLLRKHSRAKNIIPSNSQSNEQSKVTNNAEFKLQTSSEQQQPPNSDGKTQFWVCPVCGNDTKEYLGKMYCPNCERYL